VENTTGARRDEYSRRRHARRFANVNLQSFAPVSFGRFRSACPRNSAQASQRVSPAMSEAKGSGVKLDANTTFSASQLEREHLLRLARNLVHSRPESAVADWSDTDGSRSLAKSAQDDRSRLSS